MDIGEIILLSLIVLTCLWTIRIVIIGYRRTAFKNIVQRAAKLRQENARAEAAKRQERDILASKVYKLPTEGIYPNDNSADQYRIKNDNATRAKVFERASRSGGSGLGFLSEYGSINLDDGSSISDPEPSHSTYEGNGHGGDFGGGGASGSWESSSDSSSSSDSGSSDSGSSD